MPFLMPCSYAFVPSSKQAEADIRHLLFSNAGIVVNIELDYLRKVWPTVHTLANDLALPLFAVPFVSSPTVALLSADNARQQPSAGGPQPHLHRKLLKLCSEGYPTGHALSELLSRDVPDYAVFPTSLFRSEFDADVEDTMLSRLHVNSLADIRMPAELQEAVRGTDEMSSEITGKVREALESGRFKPKTSSERLMDAIVRRPLSGLEAAMRSAEPEATRRFLLWCAVAVRRDPSIASRGHDELMQMFEQGRTPPADPKAPLVLVMSGIPGVRMYLVVCL